MKKSIMIVGEYPLPEEASTGQAFSHGQNRILWSMLKQAGIDRKDCHFTYAFWQRPPGGKIDGFYSSKIEAIANFRPIKRGKYIHARYQSEIDRLWHEINTVQPNIIICMGQLALWACCKKDGMDKYRGSPLETNPPGFKAIPMWSPYSIIRQWELRIVTIADLTKARKESTFPELRRPSRRIHLRPSLADIWEFIEQHLRPSPYVSCDIETKNLTITEVGFGNAAGDEILVIPFWERAKPDGNYWPTFEEEKKAWDAVRYVQETFPTVGQNFSYDMQYFWRTMGIPSPKFLGDTMILHHALQPEMKKSLGFLGSIYTNEPSWKFMRTDHDQLKKGDQD